MTQQTVRYMVGKDDGSIRVLVSLMWDDASGVEGSDIGSVLSEAAAHGLDVFLEQSDAS